MSDISVDITQPNINATITSANVVVNIEGGGIPHVLKVSGVVATENDLPIPGVLHDIYITTDIDHYWWWSGTEWIDVGPAQGPTGATGPTGPTGPAGSAGGFDDPQTIFSEAATTETLSLSQAGAMVMMNNANPVSLEIPTNANVAFPVGTHIDISQEGDGQVTITPLSGVTLRSRNGTKLAGKYAGGTLFQRATDEWYFFGDATT